MSEPDNAQLSEEEKKQATLKFVPRQVVATPQDAQLLEEKKRTLLEAAARKKALESAEARESSSEHSHKKSKKKKKDHKKHKHRSRSRSRGTEDKPTENNESGDEKKKKKKKKKHKHKHHSPSRSSSRQRDKDKEREREIELEKEREREREQEREREREQEREQERQRERLELERKEREEKEQREKEERERERLLELQRQEKERKEREAKEKLEELERQERERIEKERAEKEKQQKDTDEFVEVDVEREKKEKKHKRHHREAREAERKQRKEERARQKLANLDKGTWMRDLVLVPATDIKPESEGVLKYEEPRDNSEEHKIYTPNQGAKDNKANKVKVEKSSTTNTASTSTRSKSRSRSRERKRRRSSRSRSRRRRSRSRRSRKHSRGRRKRSRSRSLSRSGSGSRSRSRTRSRSFSSSSGGSRSRSRRKKGGRDKNKKKKEVLKFDPTALKDALSEKMNWYEACRSVKPKSEGKDGHKESQSDIDKQIQLEGPKKTRQSRIIHVGNVPDNATANVLQEFFNHTLTALGILTPNPVLSVSTPSKGVCTMEVRAVQDTAPAIERLQGIELDGHMLVVKLPADAKPPPPHLDGFMVGGPARDYKPPKPPNPAAMKRRKFVLQKVASVPVAPEQLAVVDRPLPSTLTPAQLSDLTSVLTPEQRAALEKANLVPK